MKIELASICMGFVVYSVLSDWPLWMTSVLMVLGVSFFLLSLDEE